MTAITKNLGLIKAIHEGVNPPQNIKILWYNTNPSVYKHFYYDTVATAWLPLAGSGGGGSGTIITVNGQTGPNVILDTDSIAEGLANLYFTDERAQDAIAAAFDNSGDVAFSYDDAGNLISANVNPGLDATLIGNGDVNNTQLSYLNSLSGNIQDQLDLLQTAPTLQEVTDEGNTTTNDIEFGAGKGILLPNGSRLREGTTDAQFGGSKGIAQICAVGYELKWEAGRLYVMDGNGLLIRHSLYNFTTLPSVTDDSSFGYYVGSLWSLDNGVTYICTDSTPSNAVWEIYEATPQVNSDWNATSGIAQILNKPVIDSIPSNGSSNAVSSDGVFDALALKADLVAGKVPSSQLPSYVDDVLEYANFASFPVTGETGKIYVTLDTNKTYRWSGTAYTEISAQQLQVIDVNNFASLPATGASNTLYQTVNDNKLYRWSSATSSYIIMNGSSSPTIPLPEEGAQLFVDLATTEALKACTYNNGTAGVLATLTGSANGILSELTAVGNVDQVIPTADMFILVKNQFNAVQNGIYAIQQLGSSTTPFILERIDDYDETVEIYPSQVTVNGGAVNINKIFTQKTIDPVIGTNNIVFEEISPSTTQETPVIFVHTVTSAALPACTYAAGTLVPSKPGYRASLTANAAGALGTINGVAIAAGTKILVKNQADPAQNGDYIVIKPGSNAGGWISFILRWRLERISYTSQQMLFTVKEWCVNSPSSTNFGERYTLTNTSFLNSQVGTTPLNFSLQPGTSGIALSTSVVKHQVKAAVALTIGQAVYVSSANGTNMIVSKSDYTAEATSSKTMGLIAQNLSINGIGDVVTEGLLAGLNTSTAVAGDPVWLGAAGNLLFGLANKPAAPNHMVFIGIVTRANISNGEIFVKVQNGFEIEELHNMQDVSYSSTVDADSLLIKDNATSLWKRLSLTDLKAFLKTYFDSIYTTTAAVATQISTALSGYATQSWVTTQIAASSGGGGGQAFSPQSISGCDSAPTAGTNQYYYQTISEITKTISKMVIWGYSGTDTVLAGVYRGRLRGPLQTSPLTLIGQGSIVADLGPNIINLTPVAGQNLNITAGEYLVVGIYTGGTSFRFFYKPGFNDIYVGQTSTTDLTTSMPDNPSNAGSAIRFACTLY